MQKQKSLDALLQEEAEAAAQDEPTAEQLAAEEEERAAAEAERKRELEDMMTLDLPRVRRNSLRQLEEEQNMEDELEDLQQLDLAAVRRKSLAAADEASATLAQEEPPSQLDSQSWLEEVSSSVSRGMGAAWSSMSNVLGIGSTGANASLVSVSTRVSEEGYIHLKIKALDDDAARPSVLTTGLDAIFKSEPKETRKDDKLFNDPFPEEDRPAAASRSVLPDTFMARFKQRPYLLGFC